MSHLFIKKFVLQKDLKENGEWLVSVVDTNKGKFSLGADINNKIDQSKLDFFIEYLKEMIVSELIVFLDEEKKENK